VSVGALSFLDLFGEVKIDFVTELGYECTELLLCHRALHLAFADEAMELFSNLQFKVDVLLVFEMLSCRRGHVG